MGVRRVCAVGCPLIPSEKDYYDKRSVESVPVRTQAEIHAARVRLAEVALTTPEPAEWLRDVLEAMGLDLRGWAEARQWAEPCYPYGGTRRGYIIHLGTYTRMCDLCKPVRVAELARPRRHEGELA